jgi:PHD/YefM family antitoxin component YafN of YafNO toxin-antitoxin module
MAECPWFETAGDDNFRLAPVDIDGDGTAEVIISEGRWESWTRTLHQIRDGQLMKTLKIAGYGS